MGRIATVLAALFLAACSGGGLGLLGGSKPKVAPVAAGPVNTPENRALQVGFNTVRAEKCGFKLDAAKLKASYLAYEAAQGLSPDQLPALERAYKVSTLTTKIKIAETEKASELDYCNGERVKTTRNDLQRYLAGDFTARAPKKKLVIAEPLIDLGEDAGTSLADALKPKE